MSFFFRFTLNCVCRFGFKSFSGQFRSAEVPPQQSWFQTWSFAIFMRKRSFVLFCAILRSFVPSRVFAHLPSPEGPKIKKIRDFERDWKFRARIKCSSEPPAAALFFVGKSRSRDWNFRSRLKISIEIEHSSEIEIFWSLCPLGLLHVSASDSV